MQNKKAYELVTTGRPDDPAFPHAVVLTVSFVISPVIGLVVTVALLLNKTWRQRRGVRTPRLRRPRSAPFVSGAYIASIASRPASVTIASAPRWDETARL